MKVIKFNSQWVQPKESFINKLIRFFLELIIPVANSDFEEKIPFVITWLVEFQDEQSTPSREIGIDIQGNVIVKMPNKRNYGYWVDNVLKLDDFKIHFEIEFVTQDTFEEYWQSTPVQLTEH